LKIEDKASGKVSWKCPSNIALVKYWGKFGRQYPKNPSISFTLSEAHTITHVEYVYNSIAQDEIKIDFKFEGEQKPTFANKVQSYLNSISDVLPIVKHLSLNIESENSFPHSSGIASSASSMAALAMCLISIEKELTHGTNLNYQKASFLSRLGSGSACRSVFEKVAIWGEVKGIEESSNDFAIPYFKKINPIFHTFHDDILIVSAEEKSVSSRAGHALMESNAYGKARFQQANEHMAILLEAMKSGDLETFGYIVEKEALTLHALMMASDPPYMLLEPNTIQIIKKIQSFRKDTATPVYFTLDAGPNIHLLYPTEFSPLVNELKNDLKPYCVNGRIIEDKVGDGPIKIL